MVRTQIYLTEYERQALSDISMTTVKKLCELIREAVSTYISNRKSKSCQAILKPMIGVWKDHRTLVGLRGIRAEWDRVSSQ